MKIRMLFLATLVATNFVCLFATTIVPFLSVGDMLEASEVAVSGRVVDTYTSKDGDITFTGYVLEVENLIKGTLPGPQIRIRGAWKSMSARGVASQSTTTFTLVKGGTYAVFLREVEGGWIPMTESFGIYQEITDETDVQYLMPYAGSDVLTLEHPSGQRVEPRQTYLPEEFYSALRERLNDASLRVENSAARQVPDNLAKLLPPPDECNSFASDFGGSRPLRRVRWDDVNIIIRHNQLNPSVGSGATATNAHERVQAAIASLNANYTGINLQYGGIVTIDDPMCFVQARETGPEDPESITISFLPQGNNCRETGIVGCAGTLGQGGPSFNTNVVTTPNGDEYYTITTGGVVLDEDAGCLSAEDYRILLEHELTHALGFDHIEPGDGAANINPICCIAITALDISCFNYVYPPAGNLPVDFLSFTGTMDEKSATLNWATAREENNDFYTLERSSNGTDFMEITRVSAGDEADGRQNYEFTDNFPFSGTNFYRLSQTDTDGSFRYLGEIVALEYRAEGKLNVIPNPARGNQLQLVYPSTQEGLVDIALFNATGQIVLRKQVTAIAARNVYNFNLGALINGVYTIRTVQNGKVQSLKFVRAQ